MSDLGADHPNIKRRFEADWRDESIRVARRLVSRQALAIGVALLLGLLVNALVMGLAFAFREPILGPLGQAVGAFAVFALLRWVPPVARHPLIVSVIGSVVLASAAAYMLSGLGGFDGPFFYVAYVMPCAALGLPLSLPKRVGMTFVVLGAFLLVFFGTHPEHLSHRFAHVAWSHLVLLTAGIVYFGDAFMRAGRERFRLEWEAKEASAGLEEDVQSLAKRVQSRTEDWLAVSDRATSIRWEERATLARNLHDEVGQFVVAAHSQLEKAARLGGDEIAATSQEAVLGSLRGTVQTLEHAARAIVSTYWEASLPFEVEVEDLIESFRALERAEITITLQCQQWEPEPALRAACRGILQESLNNVFKHANASRVEVEVERKGNDLRVCVVDDGAGASREEASRSDAFGLRGMRARVTDLGGQIEFGPSSLGGFSVTAILPVLGSSAAEARPRDFSTGPGLNAGGS